MLTSFLVWFVVILAATLGATEAAGQSHLRRQGQYASYSNSSTAVSTPEGSSTIAPTSAYISSAIHFSSAPRSSSDVVISSESSTISTRSTLPPLRLSDTTAYPSTPARTPKTTPYSSVGLSFSISSLSYFPITASRLRPSQKKKDCDGQTVNVRHAAFDWWNSGYIDHAVSALSFQHDPSGRETGWTILPDTGIFAVSSYFQQYSCDDKDPHLETDSGSDVTWTYFDCSWVPQTVAAATTVTTLTAFRSPSATTGTNFDVPDVRATMPPDPTISFPTDNATFTPGVNFIVFSQYELAKAHITTYPNGRESCLTKTIAYNLSEPYALTYTGADPQLATDPVSAVTGDLDDGFLSHIGRPDATVGAYTATPTVIVIVEEVFRATLAMYALATLRSMTQLDTPTPELPPGFSASPTTGDNWASDLYTGLAASARIEMTAESLLVPPPSSTISTAALTVAPASGQAASAPNQATAPPGDANAVLSQALGPAIMQGLGAATVGGNIRQAVLVAGMTAIPTTIAAVIVAGQTVIAGGAAVTLGGAVVSVAGFGSSVIIDGTSTQLLPKFPALASVDGVQMTATTAAAFNITGQTLVAGGSPVTVDSTRLSLASGGNAIVAGSTTLMLDPPAVITLAARSITADAASKFVFGPGQTLAPGGSAVVGGTTVTLVPAGTAIVIDGKTTTLGTVTANYVRAATVPALIIDDQTYSMAQAGGYIIASQTLLAGGAITFTGKYGVETVSLDRSGSIIVDIVSGKSTSTTLSASFPSITLGGQVFTPFTGGSMAYIIAGQTLTPGSIKTVVVGGSTYVVSLAPTPTLVVIQTLSDGRAVATSTETLVLGITAAASAVDKSSTTIISATMATNVPATGQASTSMMELLTALCGLVTLAAAAFL